MSFEITINDNADGILAEFQANLAGALEAVGLEMEGDVVANAPVGSPASTGIKQYHGGALKESITHKVVGDTVYVGTNLKAGPSAPFPGGTPYPVCVELGTGIFAEGGRGRQNPWTWRDKNGKFHYTHGIKPTHFMRNALQRNDHIEKYKRILEKYKYF